MSKEQELALFADSLLKKNDVDEIEQSFATAIFYVERELGVYIDENYPLLKFFSQLEEMKEHYRREKEATDAELNKARTLR